jgi:hypothetical protein
MGRGRANQDKARFEVSSTEWDGVSCWKVVKTFLDPEGLRMSCQTIIHKAIEAAPDDLLKSMDLPAIQKVIYIIGKNTPFPYVQKIVLKNDEVWSSTEYIYKRRNWG